MSDRTSCQAALAQFPCMQAFAASRFLRCLFPLLLSTILLTAAACGPSTPADPQERQGQTFVQLALALGRLQPDEVDAYFGPAALDTRNDKSGPDLPQLLQQALVLQQDVTQQVQLTPSSSRSARLQKRVQHFVVLLQLLTATTPLPFAEEAQQLYDITLSPPDPSATQNMLQELAQLLPGNGNLPLRLASFRNSLVIPADKRSLVFERALEECRRRTLQHWSLPADEQLTLEWTRDVDAAWHHYEGNNHSTLQLNPLALAYIGSALDVACHEGYPGHHAQFVLFDNAANSPLPVEETVVLLRSPDSVLREGAANFGVGLVFTPEERLAFERDVLYPLAGLEPARAEQQAKVHALVTALGDEVIPILQDYRDGTVSFNSTSFRLEREALVSSPTQLLQYVDKFGAYTAGYTVARQQLQQQLEHPSQQAGSDQWELLRAILQQPATFNPD